MKQFEFITRYDNFESRRQGRTRYQVLSRQKDVKKILINGAALIITVDENDKLKVLKNKSLLIVNGVISEIFNFNGKKIKGVDLVYNAYEREGMVVTPGFINGHAHPPMYLLRSSMSLDKGSMAEQLAKMAQFEKNMNFEDFVIGAIGDFTEEQKNGITTTFSHYSIFNAVEEAARITHHNVINAISAVSNSHPENNVAMAEKILKNSKKYYTIPAIAIHYIHKASPQQLMQIKGLIKKYKVLFTMHAAETEGFVAECVKKYGNRTAFALDKLGLLNSNVVLSHSVHFTDEEIKLVKKRKAGIIHLPTSNKIHKSGEFKYPKFYTEGAVNQIALGTDSVISKNSLDLLSEALQTRIMHHDKKIVFYEDLFKMLTSNAARILKLGKVGKILPGHRADLSIWKLNDRGFIPYNEKKPLSLVGNMITHGGSFIRDLMINGEFVISNRAHNFINETALLNQLQNSHMELRRRMGKS
ncbi:hypothetical protein C4569_03935 [Candidatus Parcubacteria bacterium]|nr:MAG: hypothetical protein C4569_03935 [Candidatus Parcubacteria bacterium]